MKGQVLAGVMAVGAAFASGAMASDASIIAAAHKLVSAHLLDPTSGIFTGDKIGADGYVCGAVRGKNTYGGYTAKPTAWIANVKTHEAQILPQLPSDYEMEHDLAKAREVLAAGRAIIDLASEKCEGMTPEQIAARRAAAIAKSKTAANHP